MSRDGYRLDLGDFDRLQQAMENFVGDTEAAINDVLHNEAGDLAQTEIYRLMPESKRKPWKGKKPAAVRSKSLRNLEGNLFVTVTTAKAYQYLYFPDDGKNTRHHVGNQRFFARGGEKVKDEIVERCVARLINEFEGE